MIARSERVVSARCELKTQTAELLFGVIQPACHIDHCMVQMRCNAGCHSGGGVLGRSQIIDR
ncbi:MAG: hypothetical protein ACOH2G_05170 [Ewingella sp.]